MATWINDWISDTIGALPAGWTARWTLTGALTVETVTGTPNGRAAVTAPSASSARRYWSFDAAGNTASLQQARALVRVVGVQNADGSGMTKGLLLNASGSSGSENGLLGGPSKRTTSNLTAEPRSIQYTSGVVSGVSEGVDRTLFGVWVWIYVRYDGTNHVVEFYNVNGDYTQGSLIGSISRTASISAGRIGIFEGGGLTGRQLQVAWMSVATDGDTAPAYIPAGYNLSALTLSATTTTQNSAATLNIQGSTATSAITLQSGSLPPGMSLSGPSRTISGTPTTPGTYNFTLRETLAGAANSPRDTALTITVNASGAETLDPLSLTVIEGTEGSAFSSTILGTTSGSTLSVSVGSLPTGLTLNSAARTITGTPTAVGTFNFTLRETLAGATNTPNDTALSITIAAPGVTTIVDNDCEAANANLVTTTVTNPDSLTPIITLTVRAETWTGQTDAGGNTFLARLKNVQGKTPTIRFLRSSRRFDGNTPNTNFRPCWTSDRQPGRNWTSFASRTITTQHIEVQFAAPIATNEIIISTHPIQANTDFAAMISELLADSRWRPGLGANSSGVIATSPSETVASEQVGLNPIYTIVWDDGRVPSDGGPKRVAVLHWHIHASGEGMSGLRGWGFLQWFMNSATPEADRARRNWILVLNGPQQPNGLKSGHNRFSVSRSPIDFNRCWNFVGADPRDGSPAEIVAVQANLETNVSALGRRIDFNLSWHTAPGDTDGTQLWFPPNEFNVATRTPIYAALATRASTRIPDYVLVQGNTTTTPTQSNWSRTWGNAALAFPAEQGGWGNTQVSVQFTRGEQWAQVMSDLDEGLGNSGVSWFSNWSAGQAVSGVPNLRTRRALANGTHDVRVRATSGADVRERTFRVTVTGGSITNIQPL